MKYEFTINQLNKTKRMKKLFTALAIIALVSFTPPVKELTFKFSISETETVLKALSKLTYEEAAPLIEKIQRQAQKQLADTSTKK